MFTGEYSGPMFHTDEINDARQGRYNSLFAVALCLGLSGVVILQEWNRSLGAIVALLGTFWIGYFAVGYVAEKLDDRRLLAIRWIQFAKLVIVFLLVYVHWAKFLDPGSGLIWDYDPQRYFLQAQQWASSGLSWDAKPSASYVGVIYYYGALAWVFGSSPLIPALINTLTTLLSILSIIMVGRGLLGERTKGLWLLGLILLLPDILWFDCISSRESLCLFLITTCLTIMLSCSEGILAQKISAGRLLTYLVSILLLTATRATMALGVVLVTMVQMFIAQGSKRSIAPRVAVVSVLVAGLAGSAMLALSLGSTITALNLGKENLMGMNTDRNNYYVEDSVTRHLASDNPVVNAFAAPIRAMFYVVNGLPAAIENPPVLWDPSTPYFQAIASAITGTLNMLAIPLFFLGARKAFNRADRSAFWSVVVPTLILLAALGYGTQIIQERYRTQLMPMYWTIVWIGFHASLDQRRVVTRWVYSTGACTAGLLVALKILG
jgi:hypothetical protein